MVYGKVDCILWGMSMWQNVLLGAIALLMIFWAGPGIKHSIARSKQAKSDWPAALLPLALVVIFVVFLIAMV
ncbi:conserved hypothetical protein [Crenothrix polyspora]|uniref:Uncharacterized protein n=2 Tax=Crenothrix polyspora TaxID=360316 RepID=A0A1R4H910_9GAMM|nr:conserved hypothetical protein [Crenothrix polyspora]